MRTLEKHLWQWLLKGKPKDVHAQRIENSVARGTPDVEMCRRQWSAWLELKVGDPTKYGYDLMHFTPQQAEWHRRRTAVGGRSAILVQLGAGRFLVPGGSAIELLEVRMCVTGIMLTGLPMLSVKTNSARDVWEIMLKDVLMTGQGS
jgi:hypothetical protein